MPAIFNIKEPLSSNRLKLMKGLVNFGVLFLFAGFPFFALAEGSKEMNNNIGYRAYLVSTQTTIANNPFPTLGTMKVYAVAGEKIYLGSSAHGIGGGRIDVRAPDGSALVSSDPTTAIGLIENRTQEVNGPRLVAGDLTGYLPLIVPVTQTGVYEVDFISPNVNAASNSDPAPLLSSDNWIQANNKIYISAFDVSVRNAAGTAFINGRTFCNVFGGNLGSGTAGFYARFKILTKDGYIYDVDNNGQAGWGFVFFVNNKGFRDAAGNSLYQSVNTTAPPVHDPRTKDSGSDITHKIFFNEPDPFLPAEDPISETWLKATPVSPVANNLSFTGIEGTVNQTGTYPLSSVISFNSNMVSNYTIALDLNNNGVFTDPVDVEFSGTASVGNNTIGWDGKDGLGNLVAGNVILNSSSIKVVLKGGEVHFPFIDVEYNVNGIIITRTNGLYQNDVVYWNDTNIGGTDFSKNGISSAVNGHKWNNSFGDNKGVDTWTYVISTPFYPSSQIQFQQADLQVLDVTSPRAVFCMNVEESFMVAVKNNGPSSVKGAKFSFNFPTEFGSVNVTNAISGGNGLVSSAAVSGNRYDAVLDMENGTIISFSFSGTPIAKASTYNLDVFASIMRPADVTDPDATNPDSNPPNTAQAECDAAPSGLGCNNIINMSTSVQKVPVPFIILGN